MGQSAANQQQSSQRSLTAVAKRRFELYRIVVGRFFTALLDWA